VIKVQYRAMGEQTVWQDLPGGVWPRLQFCKNEAPAGAAPSCYAQCSDPAEPKCCGGAYDLCTASQPCCAGVGLQCNAMGRCEYQTKTDRADVTFDASQLNLEEGTYEMRTLTLCDEGKKLQDGPPVEGRVDRVPPRLFGAFQNPADKVCFDCVRVYNRLTMN
jgi:hypothetical protein